MNRLVKRPLLALGLFSALLGGMTAGSATATAASPTYEIVNDKTNGSLLPHGYGRWKGDDIAMMTRDPSATRGADKWELWSSLDGDYKLIYNKETGKCLTPGRPYGKNLSVVQGSCEDTWKFQWKLTPARDGAYEIKSRSAGHVLAPYRGIGPTNNHVILEKDTDTSGQRWKVNRA